MARTFYHYLMTYRDPIKKDAATEFANAAFRDHAFPKQEKNYHNVSDYLETEVDYIESLSLFDEIWDQYILDEHKNK
ncbi:YozE family protein [Brochothrix campestris]|uniref:UPF0346 protein BCAMP_10795 n=1 Tax=Brochothrix campestris FSL F6-1037 TaxID=1265861 RepID=W7CAC8_9LIST|nr:YozE family protein [Brochothrix campestris]EUJ36294.1 hypothetical protein BCAMP_10795 [Brochothrix campestris FSL F6-1037]